MSTDSAGRIRACISGLSNPLWSPRMQPLHVSMLGKNPYQEFGTHCNGILHFVAIRIDLSKLEKKQTLSRFYYV